MKHPFALGSAHSRLGALALALALMAMLPLAACKGGDQAPKDSASSAPTGNPEEVQARKAKLFDAVSAVVRVSGVNERDKWLAPLWDEFETKEKERKAAEVPPEEKEDESMALQRTFMEADEEGAPKMPTRWLMKTVEAQVGEQASALLRWEGHLDAVVWYELDGEKNVEVPGAPTTPSSADPAAKQQGAPEPAPEAPVFWAALVPVTDAEAFVAALPAQGSLGSNFGGVSVVGWSHAGEALFAKKGVAALRPGQSRDTGAHVAIGNFPDGARFAADILQALEVQIVGDFQVYAWPGRLGAPKRYEDMGLELRDRLAVAGHDMIPARAAMIRLQTFLYWSLGDPGAWPSPMHFIGRMTEKKLTIGLTVPAPEGSRLGSLYESMRSDDLIRPPYAKGAIAGVTFAVKREEMEEFLDAVMPVSWLKMGTAVRDERMDLLHQQAKKLLEHNRGETYIGFLPGDQGLTGEVFVSWRVMDAEQMPPTAELFSRVLVEDVWMPLFLAEPDSLIRRPFTGRNGALKGHEAVFPLSAGEGKKPVNVGMCWGVEQGQFVAYFGVRPCERLVEVMEMPQGEGSAPLRLQTELSALLNLMYVPPGRELPKDAWSMPLDLNFQPREGRYFELVMRADDPAALMYHSQIYASLWNPPVEFDPAYFLGRFGIDQAMYQEPNLLLVGPPGLLGALPPTFYFGLPFSLPPSPPHLIRRAILDGE